MDRIEQLEEILKLKRNPLVIIDSSSDSPEYGGGLDRTLYMGWKGFDSVNSQNLINRMDRLSQLEKIASSYPCVIIPEVIKELTTNRDQLNNHVRFFLQTYGTTKMIEKVGVRNFKNKIYATERKEKLALLREYGERMYQFVRNLDNKKFRMRFGKYPQTLCDSLNHLSENESKVFINHLINIDRHSEANLFERKLCEKGLYRFRPEDYKGKHPVNSNIYYQFFKNINYHTRDFKKNDLHSASLKKIPFAIAAF